MWMDGQYGNHRFWITKTLLAKNMRRNEKQYSSTVKEKPEMEGHWYPVENWDDAEKARGVCF